MWLCGSKERVWSAKVSDQNIVIVMIHLILILMIHFILIRESEETEKRTSEEMEEKRREISELSSDLAAARLIFLSLSTTFIECFHTIIPLSARTSWLEDFLVELLIWERNQLTGENSVCLDFSTYKSVRFFCRCLSWTIMSEEKSWLKFSGKTLRSNWVR